MVLHFLVSNGNTASGFVLSIVLARYLTPAEVGTFSIGAVLVAFAHVFRDFGVASFVKRQKTLDSAILRSAFGVVLFTSWSVGLLLYLSSDLWSAYFGQAAVGPVVEVLAIGFVFIPFGAIPAAVLGRDFQIEKTAWVTAASIVVYFSTSVWLAARGYGAMTMAWANLANILASCIGYSILRPANLPWLPSFRGWSRVMNFGAGTVLTSSLNAIDKALPDMLLGKLAGPGLVGLFNRAQSTVGMVNKVIAPTIQYFALPYLARTHHAKESVADELVRGFTTLACLIWPALVFAAMHAKDIVIALYGLSWTESSTAIPWLSLMVAVQTTFTLTTPALAGIGRPYLASIAVSTSVGLKIALSLWLFDGTLTGIALAFALAECLCIPIYLFLNHRYLGLTPIKWLTEMARPALFSGLFAILLWPMNLLMEEFESAWHRLITLMVYATVVWVLTAFALRLPIANELGKTVRNLRR